MHQPTITMELKYCERCGGLWLRPRGVPAAYCHACVAALELAEVPPEQDALRRGRPCLPTTDLPAPSEAPTARTV